MARHSLQFVPDTGAALGEARRVLRPGGRLAAVVWSAPEDNRFTWLPVAAARGLGLLRADPAVVMRPFHLGDSAALRTALDAAGFTEVAVEPVAGERRYDSVDAAVAGYRDGPLMRTVVAALTPEEADRVAAAVREALAGFVAEGMVVGRSLMLVASGTS